MIARVHIMCHTVATTTTNKKTEMPLLNIENEIANPSYKLMVFDNVNTEPLQSNTANI